MLSFLTVLLKITNRENTAGKFKEMELFFFQGVFSAAPGM
jgi:hypothetical protein